MHHPARSVIACLALAAVAAAVPLADAEAQGRVGVTSAVNQQSQLERDAARRTIVIGDDVEFEDRVITSGAGLVQVLFVDGSTFTVGANSTVVVDQFVFNPATGSGELVAEVTRGALRFVGGRLSKGNNEVRLRTPVGTLGIRGAIVEVDLDPPCLANGSCPVATATLVFGNELTLTGTNGQGRRIYEIGHAFVLFDTGNGFRTDIVPISALELGNLQRRLSGVTGQSGGSSNIPTNQTVADSGIPGINSNRAPFLVVPRPRPQIVSTISAPDDDGLGIGDTQRTLDETIIEDAQRDFIGEDVANNEPGPPPDPDEPVIRGALSGVYGTPGTFVTSSGVTVGNPGLLNLLGDAPGSTISVELIESSPGNPVAVQVADLTFAFPTAEGETTIDPVFSAALGRTVRGTILGGPGGFALFYLQDDTLTGADGQVVYIVAGSPTPANIFYPAPNSRPAVVRTYDLGTDYQRQNRGVRSDVPLLNPLVAQTFGNAFLENVAETPYYIIERIDVTDNARTLYAALGIEGQGLDQRSMIVSDAGDLFDSIAETDEAALGIGGTRRGSFRTGALAESTFMRGGTGSLAVGDPTFNTALVGPNGQSFVYSSGSELGMFRNRTERQFVDVTLADPLKAPLSPLQYSSATVPALLTGSALLSSLDRPGRVLTGYAAGMTESGGGIVTPFRSEFAGDVVIAFNPSTSTLGGVILTRDVTSASPMNFFHYAFGFDVTGTDPQATAGARSAYLDSDVYAANSTGPANDQGSFTTILGPDVGPLVRHTQADPGTYLVSSGAVPQPQLFADAGVTPCECRFMEWGWWGSQTEFQDPSLPGGKRTDFVHLGTWAAGDIPTNDELPTVGTGVFNGHAVGNVARVVPGGVAQYVAAGAMSMTYDFAAREGTLGISNFDGRSFSGSMTGSATPGVPNEFSGPLSGSGLSGAAVGSFARGPNGPAQGVLGTFDVGTEDYLATGTFMGQQ